MIAILVVLAFAAPIGLFCLEVLLSLWPRRITIWKPRDNDVTTTVLIPAHDEELVLAATLNTLRPTLTPQDRILVVADNCSDGTAEIARRCGAEVIERKDEVKRGKGYALDFGFRHLAKQPPDVVIVLDADCEVGPQTVAVLTQAAHSTQRPAQGLNLCDPDPQGGPLQAVSGMAFRFKNLVRTRGLIRLGGNCYLTGTGMALPWPLVELVKLASGNTVEDMQLGIDFILAGKRPLYVPEARVDSPLPQPSSAARTQRTRWEHGHLRTIFKECPRLLWTALRMLRWDVLLLALDLAIPPLSLLVLTWATVACFAAVIGLLTGDWNATWLAGVEGLALAIAVFAGWLVHCRRQVKFTSLISAPIYAISKLPIYLAFLTRPQNIWVRTQRHASSPRMKPSAFQSLEAPSQNDVALANSGRTNH